MQKKKPGMILVNFTVIAVVMALALPAFAGDPCGKAAISSSIDNYKSLEPIEITPPEGFVYAIVDGYPVPHQFVEVRARIRSAIVGPPLPAGILWAKAEYVKRTKYETDLSTGAPVESELGTEATVSESAVIDIDTLDNQARMAFTFDFSTQPIPAGIFHLFLKVCYQAEESDRVIVGKKDLNEPMHIIVMNCSDRFYLDGVLRTGDEIRQAPDLRDRVDFDGDRVINEYWQDGEYKEPYVDPFNITVSLGFGIETTETPVRYYTDLAPGHYGRLIFLSEGETFTMKMDTDEDGGYDWVENTYSLTGVKDHWLEEDDGSRGEFEFTHLRSIRNIITHDYFARISAYPNSSGIFTATWPEMTFEPVSP